MVHLDQYTLQIIATFSNLASALAFIFTALQLYLSSRRIKRENDNNALNFLLETERQSDPMWELLYTQNGDVIRRCWSETLPEDWSEADLRAFIFWACRFRLVSRIVNLQKNKNIRTGMSPKMKAEFFSPWLEVLKGMKNNSYAMYYYEYAKRNGNHNPYMMDLCREVFD